MYLNLNARYKGFLDIAGEVVFAITDDEITGYSSLYYLIALPIDVLKIDAAFVAKLLADNKYAEIVKTIMDLGHTLNMEVVAEGVESVAQAKRLLETGCDQLQGFWLAEPKNYHNINT